MIFRDALITIYHHLKMVILPLANRYEINNTGKVEWRVEGSVFNLLLEYKNNKNNKEIHPRLVTPKLNALIVTMPTS